MKISGRKWIVVLGICFLCQNVGMSASRSFCEVNVDESSAKYSEIEKGWPRGPRGYRGPRGHRGSLGSQGLTGVTGASGDEGLGGLQGPQGLTGPQGPSGGIAIGVAQSLGPNMPPVPTTQTFLISTQNPLIDQQVTDLTFSSVSQGADFSFDSEHSAFVISNTGWGGVYLILYGLTGEAGAGLAHEMEQNPTPIQAWLNVWLGDESNMGFLLAAIPLTLSKSLDSNRNKVWITGFGQTVQPVFPGSYVRLSVFLADSSQTVSDDTSIILSPTNAIGLHGEEIDCGVTFTIIRISDL